LKGLEEFLASVRARYSVDDESLLKVNIKRFVVGEKLRGLIFSKLNLVYAGKYLGKMKKEFLPSSILLDELNDQEVLNRIHTDRETAWLFVCGRDIFEDKIQRLEGKFKEGNAFLVMHEGHCLGYGRVEPFEGRMILRNVFDIGDFLRRERQQ
jgi:ribosome biogenesis protein Nip4